jgi:hypothetical protein
MSECSSRGTALPVSARVDPLPPRWRGSCQGGSPAAKRRFRSGPAPCEVHDRPAVIRQAEDSVITTSAPGDGTQLEPVQVMPRTDFGPGLCLKRLSSAVVEARPRLAKPLAPRHDAGITRITPLHPARLEQETAAPRVTTPLRVAGCSAGTHIDLPAADAAAQRSDRVSKLAPESADRARRARRATEALAASRRAASGRGGRRGGDARPCRRLGAGRPGPP